MDGRAARVLDEVWAAVGGDSGRRRSVEVLGDHTLGSALAVSELAVGTVAAAAAATVELADTHHDRGGQNASVGGPVQVDRALVNQWFSRSLYPVGWALPAAWDAVAGDYLSADGWIKLHTNAPHHRRAALAVLGLTDRAERTDVATRVAGWAAEDLEVAVVAAGGCAARMRSVSEWAQHPQGIAVAAEPLVHLVRSTHEGPLRVRPLDGARPLAGIRVLDLTRVLAGPVATRWLAGLGADVLRIDPPDWEEPAVVPEMTLGKRCARLDLRAAEGRQALAELLRCADVMVHGYRPRALDRLGLPGDERQPIRPGLIDVSLNAYGNTGPWAQRRGFDSLVQMSTGINDLGRQAGGGDRPRPLPVQALDHATGYLLAAAALRGLTERQRDGRGWLARVSLARTAQLLMEVSAGYAPSAGSADVGPPAGTTEVTPWGPAVRLRPPVQLPGTPVHWDSPAVRLGSAHPAWR